MTNMFTHAKSELSSLKYLSAKLRSDKQANIRDYIENKQLFKFYPRYMYLHYVPLPKIIIWNIIQ